MHGGSDTDDALEAMLLKAELKRRQGTFGGEAAAPPCSVQLEPYLDLVDTRPVIINRTRFPWTSHRLMVG